MSRRFPPPWSVTDEGSSWCVKDATGFSIVWFCYQREGASVFYRQDLMTREEAYAMAVNFARVPVWLGKA